MQDWFCWNNPIQVIPLMWSKVDGQTLNWSKTLAKQEYVAEGRIHTPEQTNPGYGVSIVVGGAIHPSQSYGTFICQSQITQSQSRGEWLMRRTKMKTYTNIKNSLSIWYLSIRIQDDLENSSAVLAGAAILGLAACGNSGGKKMRNFCDSGKTEIT